MLQDHVTVVFDAKDVENITTEVIVVLDRMPGTQMLLMPWNLLMIVMSGHACQIRHLYIPCPCYVQEAIRQLWRP